MALASDTVELLKVVVGADLPIDCAMATFDPSWINVYYGHDRIQAVYGTDYSVTVALDHQSFVLSATASLVTKLTDSGEGYNIRVVRFAPYTNAMTETDAFKRSELVEEFDRISMKFMQLQYQFGFVPEDFAATIQAALDAVADAQAAAALASTQAGLSQDAATTATSQAVISTSGAGTATSQAVIATGQASSASASAASAAASLASIQALGIFVLSGSGAPSNGIGQNGWYYIDYSAQYLYGPKAAGVWPAGVPMTAGGGAGDVFGPAGGTAADQVVAFSGTTGKIIKTTGILISALAPLASPALTGNPTAPTQAANNNSTRLATTAYADAIAALKANLASPTFTGAPLSTTPAAADNTTKIATTAFVQGELAAKAPLASPVFTGNPTGPTPSPGDNDTSLATTAFVTAAVAAAAGAPTGAMMDFAAASPPAGWLACDGSAVSRTTYAALFAVIASTWGAGDGSTTFNLPDFRGRVTVGAGTGIIAETQPAANWNVSDVITVTSNTNKWITGRKVQITTSGVLPTGISAVTDYWVRRLSATTIELYTTLLDAVNVSSTTNRVNITATGSGNHTLTCTLTARTIADLLGEEAHALAEAELFAHTHTVPGQTNQAVVNGTGSTVLKSSGTDTSSTTGSTVEHNNMQPSAVVTKIIKT